MNEEIEYYFQKNHIWQLVEKSKNQRLLVGNEYSKEMKEL